MKRKAIDQARQDLENRYLDLTQVLLPSLGRTRGWAVADDHAFTRIVLDHLFGERWYNHLGRSLRPHKQLNNTQLAQAVSIAEKMSRADDQAIAAMNDQSLAWRDVQMPPVEKRLRKLAVSR